MQLSEEIRIGSLYLRPICGQFSDSFTGLIQDATGGCALGMSQRAVGDKQAYPQARHPWLMTATKEPLPCGCTGPLVMGSGGTLYHVDSFTDYTSHLVHLFNYHVATIKDWTIDRLCEWVASVEPFEAPTPEQEVLPRRQSTELSSNVLA